MIPANRQAPSRRPFARFPTGDPQQILAGGPSPVWSRALAKLSWVFALLLQLPPFVAHAAEIQPLVWEVRGLNRTNILYLAGTIHYLRPADYPIPEAYTEALQTAKVLALETDLDYAATSAVAKYMQAQGTYPAWDSIKAHLSATTYARLASYAAANNLSMTAIDRLKPWYVIAVFANIEASKLSLDPTLGVDRFLNASAKTSQTRLYAFESAEAQVASLQSVSESQQIRGLDEFLADTPAARQKLLNTVQAWLSGDADTIGRLGDVTNPNLNPIYNDRNRRWLPQIESFLTNGPNAMVAVGSGHLASDIGLVSLLQARGYIVRRMNRHLLPPLLLPAIVRAPSSATAPAGQSVILELTASGSPPLAYQWYQNGTALVGETNASLALRNLTSTQAGRYEALVTNAVGWVKSAPADVAVTSPILPAHIVTQPLSTNTVLGGSVSFTVAATGSPTILYQWQKDGRDIPNANRPVLQLTNLSLTDAGQYTVIVSNTAGRETSLPATLTVAPPERTPETWDLLTQPHLASWTLGAGWARSPAVSPVTGRPLSTLHADHAIHTDSFATVPVTSLSTNWQFASRIAMLRRYNAGPTGFLRFALSDPSGLRYLADTTWIAGGRVLMGVSYWDSNRWNSLYDETASAFAGGTDVAWLELFFDAITRQFTFVFTPDGGLSRKIVSKPLPATIAMNVNRVGLSCISSQLSCSTCILIRNPHLKPAMAPKLRLQPLATAPRLSWGTEAGRYYIVQSSDDLHHWRDDIGIAGDGSGVQMDVLTDAVHRFLRLHTR